MQTEVTEDLPVSAGHYALRMEDPVEKEIPAMADLADLAGEDAALVKAETDRLMAAAVAAAAENQTIPAKAMVEMAELTAAVEVLRVNQEPEVHMAEAAETKPLMGKEEHCLQILRQKRSRSSSAQTA